MSYSGDATNGLTSEGDRFKQLSVISCFRWKASGASGEGGLEAGEIHGALEQLSVHTP